MGHVNNAVYLSYFEVARMDYFDKHLSRRWDWTEQGIILARNEVDYIQPVFLLDRIYTETEVTHVGSSSFTMVYTLFKETENGPFVCTRGKSVLVCFDFNTHQKQPVPDAWRTFMQA